MQASRFECLLFDPLVTRWIYRDRSKHRLALRCSGSRGSAGGCSDGRRLRSGPQDHRAGSSDPARCGALSVMPTLDLAARFVAMRYLSLSTVLPYSMRSRSRGGPYTDLSVSISVKILA